MSDRPVPPMPPLMGPVDRAGRPRIWWGIGDFFLIAISGFVVGQIVGAVYIGVTGVTEQLDRDLSLIAFTLVGQAVGWIGGAALISRWKGRGSIALDFGRLRPQLGDWPWLLVGVGLQVATLLLFIPISLLQADDDAVQPLVEAINDGGGISKFAVLIAVFTVGPIAEEVLFRGVLLRSLQRRFDHGWAVLISAVAFAVIHLLGADPLRLAIGLVPWTAVGLVCGIRAVRSGGLAQPILIHIGFNALTAMLLLIGVDAG